MHYSLKHLLKIISRPGLYIFYGRPNSFKTKTAITLALRSKRKTIYVGLAKHSFITCPRFFNSQNRFFKALNFREEIATLLELEAVVDERSLIIYDGFGSLVLPLYAYQRTHAIYSASMLAAAFLHQIADTRKSSVVVITGEGARGRPLFYAVLRPYAHSYFHFLRGEDLVKIEFKGPGLSTITAFSAETSVLLADLE